MSISVPVVFLYFTYLIEVCCYTESYFSLGFQYLIKLIAPSMQVIQLRKSCSHPYLFAGIEPEPYEEGEHLVQVT